ncbi:hypothetical protein Scep_016400 [Stephania cephalantha]|uniref:Uncharacterized protein n=1 Tax=Stephania cephalantha TaxID=152367 RepID=A0AAP0IPH5_9MAGN
MLGFRVGHGSFGGGRSVWYLRKGGADGELRPKRGDDVEGGDGLKEKEREVTSSRREGGGRRRRRREEVTVMGEGGGDGRRRREEVKVMEEGGGDGRRRREKEEVTGGGDGDGRRRWEKEEVTVTGEGGGGWRRRRRREEEVTVTGEGGGDGRRRREEVTVKVKVKGLDGYVDGDENLSSHGDGYEDGDEFLSGNEDGDGSPSPTLPICKGIGATTVDTELMVDLISPSVFLNIREELTYAMEVWLSR